MFRGDAEVDCNHHETAGGERMVHNRIIYTTTSAPGAAMDIQQDGEWSRAMWLIDAGHPGLLPGAAVLHIEDLNLEPTDGPTGFYGSDLKSTIEAFQRRRGLIVDAAMDPGGKTIRALKRELEPKLKSLKEKQKSDQIIPPPFQFPTTGAVDEPIFDDADDGPRSSLDWLLELLRLIGGTKENPFDPDAVLLNNPRG